MKPLLIAAAVVIVIGLGVLLVNKAQSADPTVTAAPPSGTPGQTLTQASPDKMARQQQIRSKMNAESGLIQGMPH